MRFTMYAYIKRFFTFTLLIKPGVNDDAMTYLLSVIPCLLYLVIAL